jgi:Uma2 family endonuclease
MSVGARSGQRLVLAGVSWPAYLHLGRIFEGRHIRITYDRGDIEIVTLGAAHERFKHLLGLLICALVEELGWHMAGFGSMTFRRSTLRRGLEPDECYWIQNEPLVRGRDKIDLGNDPPPDLVVEIDVTRSSLDRLAIYSSMKIPEVWQYNGRQLRMKLLTKSESYEDGSRSRAFPFLSTRDVERFMNMRSTQSETAIVRRFRKWAEDRISSKWR